MLASLVTGAAVMLAVSAWQLRRGGDRAVFGRSARLALVMLVPAILLAMLVGDELGVIEAKYQPMKIAAAEAQWTTCQPCSFSLIQIGGGNNDHTPTQILEIPHLLSLLATNHWNGKVIGMSPLQAQYAAKYGPGNYVPDVFIQYWGMRVMAYLAVVVVLVALWGLWLNRRKKLATSRRFLWVATWMVILPFLINTAGWLLTESGRQPWIVQGIMLTKNGLSPSVSATELWISVIVFVLLYGALGTVDLLLMLRYSRKELGPRRPAATPRPTSPFRRCSTEAVDGVRSVLVHPDHGPVDRVLRARGLRPRRRHAARGHRQGRARAADRDQHDRTPVGRERGLARRRGRRHLRRVPWLVRHPVLRLLPGDRAAARRADPARRVVRVPRQEPGSGAGGRPGARC